MIDLSRLNGLCPYLVQDGGGLFSIVVGQKGDCMFSVDLKDANFQIPIHLGSRPYPRIVLVRKVY